MKIQPIVEGHGEVVAVPVLLRRLRNAAEAFGVEIGPPIRRKRSQLVQQGTLQDSVKLALKQPECRAILVLFDADDDCPRYLIEQLEVWARQAAGPVPCSIVMANREYEAWLLASVESLRGRRSVRADASFAGAPEGVRDAKGELERLMDEGSSYMETTDQAALSAKFDMKLAYARCRSFRKLVKAFGELAKAIEGKLPTWPPSGWVQESEGADETP